MILYKKVTALTRYYFFAEYIDKCGVSNDIAQEWQDQQLARAHQQQVRSTQWKWRENTKKAGKHETGEKIKKAGKHGKGGKINKKGGEKHVVYNVECLLVLLRKFEYYRLCRRI
jgi:hypothetical protein